LKRYIENLPLPFVLTIRSPVGGLDEVLVGANGKMYFLRQAIDQEGEVKELFVPDGGVV